MKLTTIQATALKGQTFTHQLGPCTIFAGLNDAGKTARADAVRLVLLGHLPSLGKTNAATFALSSGAKMSVGADIEGLGPVRREWTAKGKTVKATEAGTEALPETPLVLLDAAEYFGQSDAGRVKMLWQVLQVDPAKWSPGAVLDAIAKALGQNEMAMPSGWRLQHQPNESLQSWMERLGDTLTLKLSEANAEVRRWEQTKQGITAAGLEETPVDPGQVAAALQQAQQRLQELVAEHAKLKQVVEQQTNQGEHQARVKARMARLREAIGDTPLPAGTPEEIDRQIEEITAERATLVEQRRTAEREAAQYARTMDRLAEIQRTMQVEQTVAAMLPDRRTLLAGLEARLADSPEDQSENVMKALTAATRAKADVLARQRANDAAQEALEREAKAMVTKPHCPICGTQGEKFHEQVEELYKKRRSHLQGEAVEISKEFTTLTQAETKAQAAQNDLLRAQKARQSLERQIGDGKTQVQISEAAAKTVELLRAEAASIGTPEKPRMPDAGQVQQLSERVERLTQDRLRIDHANTLAAAEEELRSISIDGAEDAEMRAADMEDSIAALREKLEELEQQRKRAANQAGDRTRLAQADEAQTKAEAEVSALKVAQSTLATAKAKLIQETMRPLLDRVNQFTTGILDTPLEFRDGEIGRYKAGTWVPVRCFGGTHQAVTHAGIQAALGMQAPARIVIVDELGRFDARNKRRFMENVLKAQREGLLEQFIGIDVDGAPYADLGLTVETLK